MEENFEALLEMYMNEEEINEKIKSDNEEIKEEEQNIVIVNTIILI